MALPAGWEGDILNGLGAPTSATNIASLDAWIDAEKGGAANDINQNPFNTTLTEPGSTPLPGNPDGVQVFPQWYGSNGGLAATVSTLQEPAYSPIVADLQASAPTSAFEQAVNASPWGTHFDVGGTYPPSPGTAPAGSDPTASSSGATDAVFGLNPMKDLSQLGGGIMTGLVNLVFYAAGLALIVGGFMSFGKGHTQAIANPQVTQLAMEGAAL